MNLPDPHIFPLGQNGAVSPLAVNRSIQLFYHGNISYRYGLDNLVKAFAQVHHQIPQTRLVIHGRGDYQLELEHLINKLGLSQAVVLSTELIPLEDVVPLIRSADLAVVPYRYDIFTDGILPTKLMEYAALGIPTIASSTTAIKTYFDKEMVYLVPPDNVSALAEAIIKLVRDTDQLSQLSKNITKFSQTYNWSNEAKMYVRLVENSNSY
jgi:glycosyltransferase involved in cell wall biosynthesis